MKLVLLSFFLFLITIKINTVNSLPLLEEIYTKKNIATNQLAYKYCDSLKKNLFKGLDKESILKYEYFFSSIPDKLITDENKFLEIFKSDVKSICSYKFSQSNEEEFKSFIKNYLKSSSTTPNTKVKTTNPTAINPSMIPLLR